MFLYKNQKNQLGLIKEKPFKLEKEIQELTEKNLEKLFGLEFVASERIINGFRIDTLAYDPNLKTFVIIEYKRSSSFSVVDQGFSYLSLLLNNKSDFVLEFNELKNENLKRSLIDVDGSEDDQHKTFLREYCLDSSNGLIFDKRKGLNIFELKRSLDNIKPGGKTRRSFKITTPRYGYNFERIE